MESKMRDGGRREGGDAGRKERGEGSKMRK